MAPVLRWVDGSRLEWQGEAGRRYEVWYCENLASEMEWKRWPGGEEVTGVGPLSIDVQAKDGVTRFFRLRIAELETR
jgi:hypothetical protein